jgi:hypothetical protein
VSTPPPAPTRAPIGWKDSAFWVAIAIIGGFVALLGYMISQLGAGEVRWTRLAFLYGTVEAVLFAAVGAIFGTRVQRERAEHAEARASDAEKRADEHAEDAVKGRTLAAAAKAEAMTAAPGGAQFSFEATEPVPENVAPVARLATLAEQLFPERDG